MKVRSTAIVLACALAASGARPAGAEIAGKSDSYYRGLGARENGPRLTVPPEFATRFAQDPGANPKLRRELAYNLIAQSDADCEDYLIGISVAQNRVASGFSLTSLWLSAIATVTTPVRSANLLSAGSTAIQGSTRALKDTIFGGNEYRLLYTAVKSGREERRRQLFADIEDGAYDSWSAQSIATQLTSYHYNCGINYGLERLEAATKQLAAKPADPPVGQPNTSPGAPASAANAQPGAESRNSAAPIAKPATAAKPGPRAPNS